MKKTLLVFAAAAAMLAGCQMADDFAPEQKTAPGKTLVFKGIIEDQTRTTLSPNGDNYKVCWNMDTKIVVTGYKEDSTEGAATYTSGESGSDYSYFTQLRGDTLATGPFVAYSPAGVQNGFPGTQTQVNGVLGWIPMRAESNDETLLFKNLGGLLKLNITTTATGAAVKTIVISADQPMAGAYTVVDNAAVIAEDGQKSITLECGEGVAIGAEAVPFFIAVPANTYTGMSIKINTADGKTQTLKMKSGASVAVERAKYYEANFAFDKLEAVTIGGEAMLPSGQEFNAAIKMLSGDDACTYASIDYAITKIVFDTNSANTNGENISDISSDKPIYLSVDRASGVAIVSTPASTLVAPSDASYMFAYFAELEEIVNLKALNTENAEDMSYMFCLTGCTYKSLKSLDLSNFKTANCTTMRSMFNGCDQLTELDLSSFNTENVENMNYMFQYCSKLKSLDLSSFNTENCTVFGYLFAYCYELETVNVSSFNTENGDDMRYMFAYCYKINNLDITNFDVSSASNVGNFFWHCHELSSIDLSNFDPCSATEMRSFFNRCYMLKKIDMTHFNPESVTASAACGYFFYGCIGLEELYCGETFMFPIKPNYPFSQKFDYPDMLAGLNNGGFTIYCDQDVCDYWASTGLRWLHNGNGSDIAPLNIVFKHFTTGQELYPAEWPAN